MSVSVFVNGIREPDGRLADMVSLACQCHRLGATIPKEVMDYFDGTDALGYIGDDDRMVRAALEVNLKYGGLNIDGLIEGDVEYDGGAIIDLTKLPDDITKLRVYMS